MEDGREIFDDDLDDDVVEKRGKKQSEGVAVLRVGAQMSDLWKHICFFVCRKGRRKGSGVQENCEESCSNQTQHHKEPFHEQ